ncbi:insulinase family protein, partial [Candidatus Poribacteria bacterium]|nr:insulinase family protein [Candidatus Poribacteria bacterium]
MRLFWKLAACLAAMTLVLGLAGCQSLGIGGDVVRAKEGPYDYEMMTLKNGMRVVTLEDHSTPVAAVQVWYHVGSKNEQPDRRGFAHMFEHMMFRGTDRLGPEGHFNYIQQTGGDNNAYTSFDQTVYIQEVPANQVEMVLWLEAERMGFLKIDEEGFKTERKVVAEEYRMGAEQPYGTVADKVLPEVFQKGTYSWTPIGDMDELNAATPEELQKFWETYYVPNNATLVVAGDIRHGDVQRMARRYFGWIPAYPDPPALAVPPSAHNEEPLVIKVEEKNGPAPVVAVAFRSGPTGHPDALPLEMLGSILGGGESSRIYKRLVNDEEVAMMAMAGQFALESDGIFGAAAVLNPMGAKKAESLAAIREEFKRIAEEGPTERELEKVKNSALAQEVRGQMTVSSKASSLGSAVVLEKDIDAVNRRFDEIRAVTVADVKRVAQQYLGSGQEIEVTIEPSMLGFLMNQLGKDKTSAEDAATTGTVEAAAAVTGRPAGKPGLNMLRPASLGDEPPVAKPLDASLSAHSQEKVLGNGMRVVVVPNHEVPMVFYSMRSPIGAYTDPAAAPGTASLT